MQHFQLIKRLMYRNDLNVNQCMIASYFPFSLLLKHIQKLSFPTLNHTPNSNMLPVNEIEII